MQVIADRFEIERLVGSGGMGEVFRARDRVTGHTVAVKVLFGTHARDTERFRREAQMLADVSDPRIVKYVAHGMAGQRAYLAMEWLDGIDLAERLERSGVSLRESILLARRIAEGLGALHDRGIVHRDIKPSNVFLPGGAVDGAKLLDLGVARLLHQTRPSTRSGVMVGTPGYMAPEQARGTREIDARADVFALGCVLYECIVGKPAFHGDNLAAILAKILIENPPSIRELGIDIPPALDDLVSRMLQKPPMHRPASAAAVLRELEAFATVDATTGAKASVPAMRAITGVERKLVSVVMANIPGLAADDAVTSGTFETLAASFDPRAVIATFGGEAELLADGSIVVVLTGKGGAGDQAAQAARCALALRSHLVDAQVALATGLATVTGRSYVGEVIERAAALLANASSRGQGMSEETRGGQTPVFLDETTAGLLDMRFDVGGDDRGLFIRGLRERETKARTLLGKPTPFVGRDRELTTLMGIYDECQSEPVARAVLVTGQPGAGKSRMTTELLRRLGEAGEENVEVWLARGDPMSEGSPFSLLARLLRRAATISGAETLVVRQQKLRARVARNVSEHDVGRVTEFLGEIASVHFPDNESVQLRAARKDSMLMGDQMRRAFTDFVLAECSGAPLVLVLEDLHWGDLPSVSFIDSALRAAVERPLMVVAVARAEVHDAFPNLWEQRSLQEIRLGPLVRRAGERLVREVLGDRVTDTEVTRLLDRASGNVFFLEELIRAYAEGGTGSTASKRPPTPPSSSSSLLDSGEAWSLPGTVLAMVEARLERLDPMARRVLRAASVFGEVFWRGGLLALTGGEYKQPQVDEWLAELTTNEIVQRRDVSRFPGEHEYAFRHALVRDAAYQLFTTDDRILGHRLAGEWLELAGEHEPMLLGEHFERGGLPTKAASYYARAATQALEGNDFAVADARARRAIDAGAEGSELGQLRHLLAEAARWAGDYEGTLGHARAALEDLPPDSDAAWGARAEAIEAAVALGNRDEVHAIADQATRATKDAPMTVARVIGVARISGRLALAGMFRAASELLASIEDGSAEIVDKDPGARAFLLFAKSARAKWVGDFEESALYADEAVKCFDLVGDARNAALQRVIAGFALNELGDFTHAEVSLTAAIATAEKLGLGGVEAEARLHMAQIYTRVRKIDRAIATLAKCIESYSARNDRVGEGRARAYLVGVHQVAKNHLAAAAEAPRALELLQTAPPYLSGSLGLQALALADSGDKEGALEAATTAMRLFEEMGATMEGESIVRVAYAEALNAAGDREGAKKAIAAARERLLARADRIKNPEWRKGFLTTIQEHVRTLARAGEWLA